MREVLVGEIGVPFDGVRREDGVTLHEAREIDDHSSARKRAAARAMDTDQRWQDVPIADLLRFGGGAFCFLDNKGFRYYLPAYMICVLNNFENSKLRDLDFFIYNLCPAVIGLSKRDLDLFATLTAQQSSAVCHFLKWVVAENDFYCEEVDAAIEDYWGQFVG